MANVRRLDAVPHIEDVHVRDEFDIEDARRKMNGGNALSERLYPRHRAESDHRG
jgi:hypothetical protein